MNAIVDIAHENGLKVISDCAQAPGAKYRGRYAGTLADIGGYSLNYHKHIHTGEGRNTSNRRRCACREVAPNSQSC